MSFARKFTYAALAAAMLTPIAADYAVAEDITVKLWTRADRSGPLRSGNIVKAAELLSKNFQAAGMDVTVKDYGASPGHAESLCYELLLAGANLDVYVDAVSDIISIHRPGEVPNAA